MEGAWAQVWGLDRLGQSRGPGPGFTLRNTRACGRSSAEPGSRTCRVIHGVGRAERASEVRTPRPREEKAAAGRTWGSHLSQCFPTSSPQLRPLDQVPDGLPDTLRSGLVARTGRWTRSQRPVLRSQASHSPAFGIPTGPPVPAGHLPPPGLGLLLEKSAPALPFPVVTKWAGSHESTSKYRRHLHVGASQS